MFSNMLYALAHSTLADLFDILLLTIIIYSFMRLIKDSRAYQMAIGLGIIGLFFLLTQWGRMVASHWLISNFLNYLIIAIIVLFQGEIRRFLTTIGSQTFKKAGSMKLFSGEMEGLFFAVDYLAKHRIGALIAIEKEVSLTNYSASGTRINADLSKDILGSLFFPHSPLHDGAVIIRGSKILSAGCLLPLPATHSLGTEFQTRTRHLAALGLSQETDAVVIVVSEEQGTISLAHKGQLHRFADVQGLRNKLSQIMQ
jgi:diadenylate cyclase